MARGEGLEPRRGRGSQGHPRSGAAGRGEAMEARGRLREAWGGWRCPGLLRGGSRDPGQAISAEIPRKALGELWASINSVCQPSGNRALKCSCYSPECLEPALGKQGSGGEGCFLLPGSVTGAGGMWGGFLPGDMAAFPPWGRPAGCWAVAALPGCGMAPECIADVCPPPLPSPPRPTARQTSGLGCAVSSGHGPGGAGDAGGCFGDVRAQLAGRCSAHPLLWPAWGCVGFSVSAPRVRPSVRPGCGRSRSASGHMLSHGPVRVLEGRDLLPWDLPRHVWTPRVPGPCSSGGSACSGDTVTW